MRLNREIQKNILSTALLIALFLSAGSSAALWSYSGTGNWDPSSSYLGTQYENYLSYQITVPLEAIASESPAQITLKIYSAPDTATSFSDYSVYNKNLSGTYDVYRKDPEATSWGAPVGSVTVGSTIATWIDTNVTVGVMYEYGLKATSLPNDTASYWFASFVSGNVLAGINVDCAQPKGRIAVVVAEDVIVNLPDDYAQYKEDLVKDGWTVHEIVTPRAPDYTGNGTGPNDALGIPTGPFPTNHIHIRNQLIGLYNTYSNELKNVVLLGKVPVARSGVGYMGPDGHGNRSAAAADAYYADMDGVWTDTGSNTNWYLSEISTAVKEGTINVPGDNKFDADNLYEITTPNSRLELGFGRIDFSNVVAAEYEALKTYLRKLHRYKTAAPDFRPGRRAIYRPGFGAITHEFMSSMSPVVGMTNMDFIVSADLPVVAADQDADSAYTKQHPYLFYFKGNSTPDYSHGGQAVFWAGMQSGWGYWYYTTITSMQNAMQRRLAEDNFALSYIWDISLNGVRIDYLYHRLGMGGTAGDMMRVSMSDRKDSYSEGGGVYSRADSPLIMQHMGDPALRIFMFPPPTGLQVLPGSGNPQLSWTASTAPAGEPPVIGYHVYRSDNANGPFTRLTSSIVAGTSYTDSSVSSGEWHYQVKAVRLEPCGGGSFYNSSLAAQQSINLAGAAALVISTNALSEANWDTEYETQLVAAGGTPRYSWSTTAALPAGLSLSSDGVISGKPATNGTFVFTSQVTDALMQSAQAQLSLNISALDKQTVVAEAGGYVQSNSATRVDAVYEPWMQISGGNYVYEGYLRFDLSGIHTNDSFVQAQLVLTVDGMTPAGNAIILKASQCADADDGWVESALSFAARPGINPAIPVSIATNTLVPHKQVVLDVSSMVFDTLKNDPAHKMTVRISTDTPASFGQSARIADRYACALAAPQLVVQTTGAEGYAPPPPVAAFSADPVSGASPLPVTFTDSSSGDITNRFWDFGDGSTTNITTAGVAHTYTANGDFTVQLIVSGGTGSATNTQVNLIAVTAPVPPVAAFSASPDAGVRPLTVTFTDSSTGSITNRFWNFGDGSTTNTIAAGVTHTYTAAGTSTVQLTVSGPVGSDTSTQTDLIRVTDPVSQGESVQLDLSGSFNYDGFVTGEEISYAATQAKTVASAIGDNTVSYNYTTTQYAHLVDPNAPTYQGIATDGIVAGGTYELAKGVTPKFGTASGNTKVNNCVARLYDNASLSFSATINLAVADQKKYSDFNILVNGSRYATLAGTMSATLSVKYVGDATWYTVWTESVSTGNGGVFGGGYNGDTGAYSKQSSAWRQITVSDGEGYAKTVGGLTVGGGGSSYMYEFATPITLDSTKVLESFKMESTTYNKSRVNDFILYAASATAVSGTVDGGTPPPPTVASGGGGSFGKGQDVINWTTVQGSGYVYSVWYSTNLLSGFQPLGTNLPDTVQSITNAISAPSVFYQIRAQ